MRPARAAPKALILWGAVSSTNGSFYGTIEFGGTAHGTVFRMMGLGPFVETVLPPKGRKRSHDPAPT